MTKHSVSNYPALINPSSPFKIYIACLTSHHEGKKHGVWVDANQSVEALEQIAQGVLATSPMGARAKYYIILATEGFDPLIIDPLTDLKTVTYIVTFLKKHGTLGTALMEYFGGKLDFDTLYRSHCMMTHNYHGVYPSKLAFVEHLFPIVPPLSLRIEPSVLHQLITDHLFIVYFFTLESGDQLHVFNYPEYTTMKPITLKGLTIQNLGAK